MQGLVAENETLKKVNTVLKVQRDSTIVVLDESKKSNKELSGQNEDLTKTIEKGSKLTIVNLKTAAFIVRSSGKEIATQKMKDLNAHDLEQAVKIIAGSARSMGIEVKD